MGFFYLFASFIIILTGCNSSSKNVQKLETTFSNSNITQQKTIKNPLGKTVYQRFSTPENFMRITLNKSSFGYYLRHLPLKPDSAKVHYYNGEVKSNKVWAAVINMDVGKTDLQQCADAVMRLRAEYLWSTGQKEKIHFNFTNGFQVDYSKWEAGYRVRIKGNVTSWYQAAGTDTSYQSFRKYMNLVFSYAGTLSLSKELKPVALADIRPGDVFIHGGSPGHAVIVMDVAQAENSNEKLFMIAQSYMPAQDIHILKNFENTAISPWYAVSEITDAFYTPEWTFSTSELMRFGK